MVYAHNITARLWYTRAHIAARLWYARTHITARLWYAHTHHSTAVVCARTHHSTAIEARGPAGVPPGSPRRKNPVTCTRGEFRGEEPGDIHHYN